MKNKKFFSLTILIISSVFLTFFIGLNKKNFYTTEQIEIQKISNFTSNNLLTNEKVSFESVMDNDKFIILNIWASWCAPCRLEHKILFELNNFENVKMIGLNYKDKYENAKSFVAELGNPYDIILADPKGLISINFGAYGVPETYIINDKKKIIKKYLGPLDNNKLNEIKSIISS